MITTIPFSERLSEHWLFEGTYHAQLRNGRELSVADFTLAMTQLIDFSVPLSLLSAKSKEEWDTVWHVADIARRDNHLTPELVDDVRIALNKL